MDFNRNHLWRAMFLCIAVIGLAACVPFPHLEWESPSVSGMLIQDGHPVEGATVEVQSKYVDDLKSVRSDAGGNFKLDPLKSFDLFIVAGDRLFDYTISITVDGRHYLGYKGNDFGYMRRSLLLQCDLDKPVQRFGKEEYCAEK